jgi:hypothetical protein
MLTVAAMSAASARQFPMTVGGSGTIRADFAKFTVDDRSNFDAASHTGRLRRLVYSQTSVAAGEYMSFEAFMCEAGAGLWSGRTTVRTTEIEGGRTTSADNLEHSDFPSIFYGLGKYDVVGMDLSLFAGKYPFGLGRRVNFFPQAGICYQMVLAITNVPSRIMRASDFNVLSFKQGGGFDFTIAKRLLLRAEALFVLRLDSEFEKRLKSQYNSSKASVGY